MYVCIYVCVYTHTHTHTNTHTHTHTHTHTLLLYDMCSPKSGGNAANKLANPMALMSTNAFHGGAMRYMSVACGVC